MSNKREMKKLIKEHTDKLIEDAYFQTLEADDKEIDKMEKVIDELVDKRFELINRTANYPLNKKRAEVKEHFNAIQADLEKLNTEFSKKIGRV